MPGSHAANPAAGAGLTLARNLLPTLADWRKILSQPLPPRSVVRPLLCLLALLIPLYDALPAGAQVRIKDIADVEGIRENQLIGYGLIVGLNNTGDKLDNAVFTPNR